MTTVASALSCFRTPTRASRVPKQSERILGEAYGQGLEAARDNDDESLALDVDALLLRLELDD